jgi:L-amino acid N-acyltransferase YncA
MKEKSPDVQFRPVESSDIKRVTELYAWYIVNTTVTFHCQSLTEEEMERMLLGQGERFGAWIIEINGEFGGFCKLSRYSQRPAYDVTAEATLYIREPYQGRGIGVLVLQFLERRAREENFHSIIGLITAENLPSINLFKKCGYCECALLREVGRKFERLLDVAIYQKILD